MLGIPVEREVCSDTRPKPLGFCLPTPPSPPTTRVEKIVCRGTDRYVAPPDRGTAGRPARGPTGGVCQP